MSELFAATMFLLFGITRFSLPEVLIAGCAVAIGQSVCNTKKRPTMIQVLFNMANLIISAGSCFLIARVVLYSGIEQYRPAVMAFVAFVYFVVNTVLVSGVLALLEGKTLREVCGSWYVWSFPYYLVGAALVGLIPSSGQSVSGEAWLVLLPLAYLIHFFVGLLESRPVSAEVKRGEELPRVARWYVFAVQASGLFVFVWAAFQWHSQDLLRFASYTVLTLIAATFKVRLPNMRGTISCGFIIRLVTIAQLGFSEAVLLACLSGIVQCVWNAKRSPTLTRTLFNGSCTSLATAAAFAMCRVALSGWLSQSLIAFLLVATLVLYLCNTFMVAIVLCLVEHKSLRGIWQTSYFWSCPYYLVGSAAAGLMIATWRVAGWRPSLLVLPVMGLVYISYRMHVESM